MLRFHYFFQGMLKKEEAASAFLAMALEGVPSFRHHFFGAGGIPDERLGHLHAQTWEAPTIEKDRVDVRLASPTHVILIENKIQSGAKQQGQLLRYYRRERKKAHSRIIVVMYLAPGHMGIDEVEAVKASTEFHDHPDDVALQVSWDRVTAFEPNASEAYEVLVKSGLDAIAQAIEDAKQEVYVNQGERKELRRLFLRSKSEAAARLTSIPLGLTHFNNEYLETKGATVTVKVKTQLTSVDRDNPTVVGVFDNGRFHFPAAANFRLTTGTRKSSPAGRWWQKLTLEASIEIPGVGTFVRNDNGLFQYSFEVAGHEAQAAAQLTDAMVGVVGAIRMMLEKEGLSMMRDAKPTMDNVGPLGD